MQVFSSSDAMIELTIGSETTQGAIPPSLSNPFESMERIGGRSGSLYTRWMISALQWVITSSWSNGRSNEDTVIYYREWTSQHTLELIRSASRIKEKRSRDTTWSVWRRGLKYVTRTSSNTGREEEVDKKTEWKWTKHASGIEGNAEGIRGMSADYWKERWDPYIRI